MPIRDWLRRKWKWKLREQLSTDGPHLRSEFRIFIQIFILTVPIKLFFLFQSQKSKGYEWRGSVCLCVLCVLCVLCNLSTVVIRCNVDVVNVIKDRNGLAMPLYSIIIDKVLIWPVGCFHLQVSFLPVRDVLTSPSLPVSEYKWASFYLSK